MYTWQKTEKVKRIVHKQKSGHLVQTTPNRGIHLAILFNTKHIQLDAHIRICTQGTEVSFYECHLQTQETQMLQSWQNGTCGRWAAHTEGENESHQSVLVWKPCFTDCTFESFIKNC